MACSEQLEMCLLDLSAVSCLSCEQATAIRCLALSKIAALLGECMSAPIQIGDVKYASPLEAIRELRQLVALTFTVCEQDAIEEGPVMETVWESRCDPRVPVCGEDLCINRFHEYTGSSGTCGTT